MHKSAHEYLATIKPARIVLVNEGTGPDSELPRCSCGDATSCDNPIDFYITYINTPNGKVHTCGAIITREARKYMHLDGFRVVDFDSLPCKLFDYRNSVDLYSNHGDVPVTLHRNATRTIWRQIMEQMNLVDAVAMIDPDKAWPDHENYYPQKMTRMTVEHADGIYSVAPATANESVHQAYIAPFVGMNHGDALIMKDVNDRRYRYDDVQSLCIETVTRTVVNTRFLRKVNDCRFTYLCAVLPECARAIRFRSDNPDDGEIERMIVSVSKLC